MKARSEIDQTVPVGNQRPPQGGEAGCLEDEILYDAYDLQLMAAWEWEGNPNGEATGPSGSGGQRH